MLPICEFNFPAPLDLAQTNFGVDLLGRLWALTEMKYRLLALSPELLRLCREFGYLLRETLHLIAPAPVHVYVTLYALEQETILSDPVLLRCGHPPHLPVTASPAEPEPLWTHFKLGLFWAHLRHAPPTVRQALQRVGGEPLIVAPKTQRSARRVALPAECVTALRAQRAQQIADRKGAGDNWKGTGHGLVFTTKNGTPIEPRNLNRSFEVLCVRAGVRKVRFHDLRHTCASLLHEQGADARMIMEVLGHSSIRVTMDIYTFVRLDSQRSAFDRVGDALRGDGKDSDDDDGAAGALVAV
ncbi:phage integrase family protein [Streptomyces sp. Ag109_O5-1]|nr:phage integrase family protein [Streptomyces sp. Ag109_O5-1]